jgi:chlorophyll(ide) b reductase
LLTGRINNAGTNTYKFGPLTSLSNEELTEIVTTNVLGVMLCCKEVRGGRKERKRRM